MQPSKYFYLERRLHLRRDEREKKMLKTTSLCLVDGEAFVNETRGFNSEPTGDNR